MHHMSDGPLKDRNTNMCVFFSDLHHNVVEKLEENTFAGLLSLRSL